MADDTQLREVVAALAEQVVALVRVLERRVVKAGRQGIDDANASFFSMDLNRIRTDAEQIARAARRPPGDGGSVKVVGR